MKKENNPKSGLLDTNVPEDHIIQTKRVIRKSSGDELYPDMYIGESLKNNSHHPETINHIANLFAEHKVEPLKGRDILEKTEIELNKAVDAKIYTQNKDLTQKALRNSEEAKKVYGDKIGEKIKRQERYMIKWDYQNI